MPSTPPSSPPPANVQLDHASHRATGTLPLRLLAHDVDLALNVGALFRIADALGVEHLHLTGTSPRPPDPKIRRSARSAERHVAWSHAADPLAVVAQLKAQGWRVVALELSTRSVALEAFDVAPGDRVCLVLGTENAGVSQALLDAADATVHIPMRGHNSSMNVANACAIAAYEIGGRLGG
ncbi:MAG TPA: TrmH family RNA methyltransferase [Burkholderiaceae bacterium]